MKLAPLFPLVNFTCALLLLAPNTYAFELSDAVSNALIVHPEVREKIHIYRQLINDEVLAQSDDGPSVDLEATMGLFNTESPSTTNTSDSYDSSRVQLSVTQTLFNGFESTNQIKQTKSLSRSSLFNVYDTADNVALDIVQGYIAVLKQRKLSELALLNVGSHENILKKIRARYDSGVGRRSQLQQTEGRVARAYASLVAQQNNLRDAVTQLHFLLGRYVDPEAMAEVDLPMLPSGTLNELIDKALSSHPALSVATHNIEASRFDYKRSLAADYPTLSVEVATEAANDVAGIIGDKRETRVVFNLNYNLYKGGANKARQQKKISAIHEQKDLQSRVRREVINTLRLAWIGDDSLTKQLVYLNDYVLKTTETVRSYSEEFFIGQRNLIDLLDAENELNIAKSQQAESYYEALAARFRIYEGMGNVLSALDLDVDVYAENLVISKSARKIIVANNKDTLPLPVDGDKDLELDVNDHCDNTFSPGSVNIYGCSSIGRLVFPGVRIEDNPIVSTIVRSALIDDEFTVDAGSILVITSDQLLVNDIVGDGDQLVFLSATEPDNGQLALDKQQNIVYRAPEDFVGKDLFEYKVASKRAIMVATVRMTVKEVETVDLNQLQYLNFMPNNTGLTKASYKTLAGIITSIKKSGPLSIKIYTHTDDVGSEEFNLILSQRRAEALKKMFVNAGVGSENIEAVGQGEKYPVTNNGTEDGQAINRRAELIFNLE